MKKQAEEAKAETERVKQQLERAQKDVGNDRRAGRRDRKAVESPGSARGRIMNADRFRAMTRWLSVALAASLLQSAAGTAAESVDFAHDVLPLLNEHCAKCHTNGRYEGDISFDTREALLEAGVAEPGKSAESAIIERVTSEDPEYAHAAGSAGAVGRGNRRAPPLDRRRVAVAGGILVSPDKHTSRR